MTLPDVRAVLPDAVPPVQPKRLGNGLSLGLVAPNVSNLDRAFHAELYFDDDGLQQVLLLPTRLLTVPDAISEFDELRQAASRRYGRELPGISPPSANVVAEARWMAGSVTVTLGSRSAEHLRRSRWHTKLAEISPSGFDRVPGLSNPSTSFVYSTTSARTQTRTRCTRRPACCKIHAGTSAAERTGTLPDSSTLTGAGGIDGFWHRVGPKKSTGFSK